MITTILWDVDGTLLDFLAAEKAAIRTLFAEFGFGECTDEAIARYSKINRRYWEKLENGELTKPEVLVGRFREFFETEGLDVTAAPAFNERYQVCLGDTIVFRDDSYEIVKSLRGRVKQYVVSNGTVLAQTKKLRLSGLGELMDGIFLSEELGAELSLIHILMPVRKIEDIFVAGRNFLEYTRQKQPLSVLEKVPLIMLDQDTSTRRYVQRFLEQRKVFVHPEFELATSDMIVQFALRNLGVGSVVRDFAKKELDSRELIELKLEEQLPQREFFVVTEEKGGSSLAAQELLRMLSETAEENEGGDRI